MMEFDAVREQFATLMKTTFASKQPSVLLAFENQPFKQPKNQSWVYITVYPGRSRRAGIGTNVPHFHLGVVNCMVMVPQDTGTKKSNDIATSLFETFADKNFSLSDGSYLTTYGIARTNRGVVNGYHTINVMCEFRQQGVSEN